MGRFFAEVSSAAPAIRSAIVSGDTRIAELVALGAPSRPSVYFDADPAQSPSVNAATSAKKAR